MRRRTGGSLLRADTGFCQRDGGGVAIGSALICRGIPANPKMNTFTFQPRWKEELVCTCHGGSFVLELTMGRLGAYLPTEDAWKLKSPLWARDLWPELKSELEAWCKANNAKFVIDETAAVY